MCMYMQCLVILLAHCHVTKILMLEHNGLTADSIANDCKYSLLMLNKLKCLNIDIIVLVT